MQCWLDKEKHGICCPVSWNVLQPLSKFTDALSSETRVTLSAIKPVLDHIPCNLLVEKDKEPSLTKEMQRVMREALNNREGKDSHELGLFF